MLFIYHGYQGLQHFECGTDFDAQSTLHSTTNLDLERRLQPFASSVNESIVIYKYIWRPEKAPQSQQSCVSSQRIRFSRQGPNTRQDLLLVCQSLRLQAPRSTIVGWLTVHKPAIPCEDFSGIVVSTNQHDLKPGQHVFGRTEPPALGALGEYAIVGAEGVVALPLPPNIQLRDASSVGLTAPTAYHCIVPNVKNGDRIFISGGSDGTGSFGIQFAKAMSCHVVTSCSGRSVEVCKSLGADEVIDYKYRDVVQTLERSGTQFDLVVDLVGSNDLHHQAHHYLKPGCKVVNVGATLRLGSLINLLNIFFERLLVLCQLVRILAGSPRCLVFVALELLRGTPPGSASLVLVHKVKLAVCFSFSRRASLLDTFAIGYALIALGCGRVTVG